MRLAPVLAAVGVLLGLLVGCSDDGSGEGDESGASGCDQLSEEQLAALGDSDVDAGPRTAELQGLSACQWRLESGAEVQTVDAGAGEWARALPALVDQVQGSGLVDDPESQRKLKEAADLVESGQQVPPDEACDLFSSLLEVQGLPAGSDRVINLVPNAESAQAISGQACVDGRFVSVLLTADDLRGSEGERGRVEDALTALIDAPTPPSRS